MTDNTQVVAKNVDNCIVEECDKHSTDAQTVENENVNKVQDNKLQNENDLVTIVDIQKIHNKEYRGFELFVKDNTNKIISSKMVIENKYQTGKDLGYYAYLTIYHQD